jgi:hypothetical protein
MHRRGSTEQAMPQFTPMKQTSQQFSPMTGAHNNNNNLLPVTQSSVSMMPTSKPEYCTNNNIANWPMTSPTHTHFFKEEQHMPYYQLQQQMIIQKFQDHSITNTKTTHEEGYNNHSPIYNNYPMLSNNNIDSFITSNIMVEPEHHHLMHRS